MDLSFYERKKAEYMVYFLVSFILIVPFVFISGVAAHGLSLIRIARASIFFISFIVMLFIIKRGWLVCAINISICAGFVRIIMLHFDGDIYQFIMMIALVPLIIGVVGTKMYQPISTYVFCVIIMLYKFWKFVRVDVNEALQFFYGILIYCFFLYMLTNIVKIINKEINESEKLQIIAYQDSLIGLNNRRKLYLYSDSEEDFIVNASLVMIDIDHFKMINDTYGHVAGDEILKTLSKCISRVVRAEDMICRWGGAEFVLLAKNTGIYETSQLAEQLRKAVEAEQFNINRKVTISLGVAEFKECENLNQLIDRADGALYRAKENGRNRVELAMDEVMAEK